MILPMNIFVVTRVYSKFYNRRENPETVGQLTLKHYLSVCPPSRTAHKMTVMGDFCPPARY